LFCFHRFAPPRARRGETVENFFRIVKAEIALARAAERVDGNVLRPPAKPALDLFGLDSILRLRPAQFLLSVPAARDSFQMFPAVERGHFLERLKQSGLTGRKAMLVIDANSNCVQQIEELRARDAGAKCPVPTNPLTPDEAEVVAAAGGARVCAYGNGARPALSKRASLAANGFEPEFATFRRLDAAA